MKIRKCAATLGRWLVKAIVLPVIAGMYLGFVLLYTLPVTGTIFFVLFMHTEGNPGFWFRLFLSPFIACLLLLFVAFFDLEMKNDPSCDFWDWFGNVWKWK